MSTLDFKVLDLDFPVGSKNKTATLVTGETEALLVDAGFTRADGHRLVAADPRLRQASSTTVFISHADPDFYFGAEVIADAFPEAAFVATPLRHRAHRGTPTRASSRRGRHLGANLPTRLVDLEPADRRPHPRGPHASSSRAARPRCPTATTCGRPSTAPSLGGVLLFQQEHVWVADTATPGAARRLDRPAGRDGSPRPAAGRPRPPAARRRRRTRAPSPHTRDYLDRLRGASSPRPPTAPPLTEALVKRYPDAGMLIAASSAPRSPRAR